MCGGGPAIATSSPAPRRARPFTAFASRLLPGLACALLLLSARPLHADTAPSPSAPPSASAPAPDFDAAADAFATFFAAKMHDLLCEMAMLDPQTLAERSAERTEHLARQKAVDDWFNEHDRSVSAADLETDADRERLRALPRLLANYAFLQRDEADRRAFIQRVDAHFQTFARDFRPALAELLRGPSSAHEAALRAAIAERLALKVGLGTRFFGRGADTTVAAMYLPFNRSIYLNLDFLLAKEGPFMDSVEHELWHHFLPMIDRQTALKNLWWEGFTEVYAETWRAAYDRQHPTARSDIRRDDSVQYGVLAAWASLLTGSANQPTLAWLAKVHEEPQFLASLAAGTPLQRALGAQWAARHHIDTATQAKLEAILTDWGWKEDDRGPIQLAKLLTDGVLDPVKVQPVYDRNRSLLIDLATAQSVLWLQDLRRQFGDDTLLATQDATPALRANIAAVLVYTERPRRLYRPPR